MEYLIWLPAPVILGFGVMGFRDGVVKRVLEIAGGLLGGGVAATVLSALPRGRTAGHQQMSASRAIAARTSRSRT